MRALQLYDLVRGLCSDDGMRAGMCRLLLGIGYGGTILTALRLYRDTL